MKVLVIIPAYNEAENITRVVGNIKDNFPQFDYVVVNDGSKDETEKICLENKYNMISLPVNCGLEGAFCTGMQYAYINGYDYAIQYDGDGQHNPNYIQKMLDEIQNKGCDIIIGSRFKDEKKPKSLRMMGNNIIQLAILLTTGKKITDPTSGMRMFNKRMIKLISKIPDLGPEPDTVAYLMRCGATVEEVQVKMSERIAGESYLNFSRSMQYMVKMCVSIYFIQWFRKKSIIK